MGLLSRCWIGEDMSRANPILQTIDKTVEHLHVLPDSPTSGSFVVAHARLLKKLRVLVVELLTQSDLADKSHQFAIGQMQTRLDAALKKREAE
jgi:hypothetical protein